MLKCSHDLELQAFGRRRFISYEACTIPDDQCPRSGNGGGRNNGNNGIENILGGFLNSVFGQQGRQGFNGGNGRPNLGSIFGF